MRQYNYATNQAMRVTIINKPSSRTLQRIVVLALFGFSSVLANAKNSDCERPFTLNEALEIAQSFDGPVNLPHCKRNLGGDVLDNTELAAAEIMGMLGIYTVACGRPPEVLGVSQLVSYIVSEATSDGGDLETTSLREVIAVRVYECVAKDR